jgi:hypothetical protein
MSSTANTQVPADARRAGRSRHRGKVELPRFLANPPGYRDSMRDDGRELVPFKLGNLQCHLVTKPEHIKLALVNEGWPPLSRGRLRAVPLGLAGPPKPQDPCRQADAGRGDRRPDRREAQGRGAP